MPLDIQFYRTTTERTDAYRQVKYNDTPKHKERIDAHCKRVQRDYFDSGLFYEETHKAQGGGVNEI